MSVWTLSHDAYGRAQNTKAFSNGLAASSWISFHLWAILLGLLKDTARTIANRLFSPKFSWNGNLTEHLRHEIVRQQYKCLHPVRFVSEPRSCSGCATVRFLSLSGGAQSANSTSLKQARRLAKASWFTLHARLVSPSGSSRSSKSYDEDLLFGHGGSLTLSHPSFLHSSPFPHFWLQTFEFFFSPLRCSVSRWNKVLSDSASSLSDTL